jgi:hypothetical protein
MPPQAGGSLKHLPKHPLKTLLMVSRVKVIALWLQLAARGLPYFPALPIT